MDKNFEKTAGMNPERKMCVQEKMEGNYQWYKDNEGVIDEGVYDRVFTEAEEGDFKPNESSIMQVEHMLKVAEIELGNEAGSDGQKASRLYAILRQHNGLKDLENNHERLGDQELLAQVLLMIGDLASLKKLKKKYENIFS